MIGIFDSGIGGLSAFREIRKLLPGQKYIYYADSAHCPYGEKSREYVIDRARSITDFLIGKGAKIIVIACNTATAAAIATLRSEYDIPFIGMEPAVKPAALNTRTGVIGVLATAGTLKGSKYLKMREKYADDVTVVEHVGQGFVELVEKGMFEGSEVDKVVEESVFPLLEAGADTIVLGCTHYPFLEGAIRRAAARFTAARDIAAVRIIDPAPAVALHLKDVMAEHGIPETDDYTPPAAPGTPDGISATAPAIRLFTSGNPAILQRAFNTLLY